ncbi:MAG: hypothetical protein COX80_01515 [Candidatus Magasanikbacteria bacterium CG_4_10_14_0_2_um_filter_33_14]|uniref:DUF5667 domain-containing protein n=1 Tax=Candidatus Magasanikbacteria bacterium CG_4_10_14_0_2_um_filter_33_14 TaxID=1974636 RepID=A0A2M7VB99_9BACT|nr:MAG: hypothetical protein COX80_01515 [Candidatus Magasanikbacteria bacterium CG_4_10_14_0_2_um_filter_33_14]
MKNIREQLKGLKNEDVFQARPSWVLSNKQMLMSQISKTRVAVSEESSEKKLSQSWRRFTHIYQSFVPTNMNKALRPILTAVMALVITTGGWVASAYAEPGDFMWSTKVAFNTVVEQGKLALTSEDKKTSLKLDFATKKAHILKQVSDSDIKNDVKEKLLKQTSKDLKEQLDGVNDSLKNSTAEDASGLVKEISLKTKEISHTLREVSDKTAGDNSALSINLAEQAVDASKQSLQMVEVVLEKKVEANSEVSEEEKMIIKEHITETVNEIKQDVEKTKAQATQIQDIKNSGTAELLNVIENESNNSTSTEIELLDNNVSSSTTSSTNVDGQSVSVETQKNSNTISSIDLSNKIDAVVKTVDTENDSVIGLLEGNMLEAVKKTIELKATVTDVSKEVSDSLNKLQTQVQVNIENNKVTASTTTKIDISSSSTLR